MGEHGVPERGLDHEVQEAFDYVETVYGRLVVDEPLTDFGANGFGCFTGGFYPREDHDGEVAFEFFLCGLGHDGSGVAFHSIKIFDGAGHALRYDIVD